MRIISGEHKGRRLVGGKKTEVRPTSDKVKESIFNVLHEEVEGKRILDLFAGVGSLGIEALSRGAESVTFVDASSQSINILKKNLQDLSLESKSTILHLDGLKALNKLKDKFQIIFADPPYLKGFVHRIINLVAQSEVLEKNGILILEHHKKETFSFLEEKLSVLKQKKFGDTMISFFLKGG
ncbi:MAG: 16S rRNA (guanine(966)-N(2))-methyltransferase RsmD [candidate division Zixibacteria bacterium]|nr:16S rRNA (guanine(966)-N(2))-methyltransferase RsmD [candidate division Zixibacteria bacterium]